MESGVPVAKSARTIAGALALATTMRRHDNAPEPRRTPRQCESSHAERGTVTWRSPTGYDCGGGHRFFMSLARDVTTVGTATLLSRLLGFFRDVGIAAVLGAGVLS